MKVIIALLWVNAALTAVHCITVSHAQSVTLIGGAILLAFVGTLTWRMDKLGNVARITAGLTQAGQVALLVASFSGSPLQSIFICISLQCWPFAPHVLIGVQSLPLQV
jgi:methyl-accepting chemotaxis protein